ncbi:HpcH/HpaI aldolase/citrate lyase family protein [Salmonella enterica]|nr:HpcH/HpaI aldolase/citrate lyase family protein [Salmonella enterica]
MTKAHWSVFYAPECRRRRCALQNKRKFNGVRYETTSQYVVYPRRKCGHVEHLVCLWCGREVGSTRLMAAIESAKGVVNAVDIATSTPRLVAIALAAFDYVMDMGTSRGDGTELFYARCAVLHAARVAGIAAYDVVWSDINNEEGFLKEVQLAKGLGFNGKSLVNPRQIELLHQAYSPTRKEVEHAYEVIAAAEEAESRGLGVVSLNGKMIDGPIIDHARKVVALSASGIRD